VKGRRLAPWEFGDGAKERGPALEREVQVPQEVIRFESADADFQFDAILPGGG
jgi:hypothetical protein